MILIAKTDVKTAYTIDQYVVNIFILSINVFNKVIGK